MGIGMMVAYIARSLDTADMGRIIVFSDNPKLTGAVGYFMAAILYTIIVSMSAAGGSFLAQQFGIHQAVGGIIIVIMVIFTVLGSFERVSKIFKYTAPVLFAIDIVLCITVILSDIEQSGATGGFPVSAMAPNWFLAAFLFISYNMLGMIPIVASSSVNAKDKKSGVLGAGAGGFMLALLTVLLITALRKDMAFTQNMDLPMLHTLPDSIRQLTLHSVQCCFLQFILQQPVHIMVFQLRLRKPLQKNTFSLAVRLLALAAVSADLKPLLRTFIQ